MTDFGLDDKIFNDNLVEKTLKWHGLLDNRAKNAYIDKSGIGCPADSVFVETKDGMASDSGVAPLKSSRNCCGE